MKTIIVAMDKNRAIGFDNDLPWGRALKDDLANFKKVTSSCSIIMGRKTFESIGSKPLPNRENIVVSSTPTGVQGVLTAVSLESAYSLARYPVFVIGGGQIYAAALQDMDRLMVTMVDGEFPESTVHFPEIDPNEWREIARQHFPADERNGFSFDIVEFEKIS